MFQGKLDGQPLQPFEYPDQNTKYVLWAARDSAGAKVKVAKVVSVR